MTGTAVIDLLTSASRGTPTLATLGALGGSGTAGTLAKFTGASTLGDSLVTESGATVNVGARTEISTNAVAPPIMDGSGESFVLALSAADGSSVGASLNAFGGFAVLDLVRANGSAAGPTVVLANQLIGVVAARGYAASAPPGYTGGGAQLRFDAEETFSVTNQGTRASIWTTPVGSTAGSVTERLRIDGSGQVNIPAGPVGVATTTPTTALHVSTSSTSSPRGIMSAQYNTGTDGARFHGRKARGTEGSPTTIVSGDNLTRWVGSGYDGTNYLEMAGIIFGTEGTIATTRVPTTISFQTATDATPSVLTTRLTINSAGLATFASAQVALTGSMTFTASTSAMVTVSNAITNDTTFVTGLTLGPSFSGSGNSPRGAQIGGTFGPSASIAEAIGLKGQGIFTPATAITITDAFAIQALVLYSNSVGAVTNGHTIDVAAPVILGTLKPTTQYGVRVRNQGAASITTSTGLTIEAQSGSTTNYALTTNGGNVGIGTQTPGNTLHLVGAAQLGGSTALTLTAGAVGLPRITASASAPGASGSKLEVVCGTNAGTAKLVMYAGTSTTAATVADNVGTGVTGC